MTEEEKDLGWQQLAVSIVLDAVDVYKKNGYPSTVETDFASPRMETLTFFHGHLFEKMCDYVGAKAEAVREKHGIPHPGYACKCENCRIDYYPEAYIASTKAASHRIRMKRGSKHNVFWKKGSIYRILPTSGVKNSLTAKEYLNLKIQS